MNFLLTEPSIVHDPEIQMFISCVLMLSMMTFHAWLVVAIILGGTVGYYTLGNSNRQFAGTHTRFYEENKL